jgi:uncharacterized protein YecE (DUF72 family)
MDIGTRNRFIPPSQTAFHRLWHQYRMMFASACRSQVDSVKEAPVTERGRIHVGTSGWSYKHWEGRFYAKEVRPKDHLRVYAESFGTAEINRSFYRLPSRDAVRHWRESVPEQFTFAVKASRFITHMKKLKDPEEPIQRLLDPISELGAKLGPILVQCPPRWRANPERLDSFLEALQNNYRVFRVQGSVLVRRRDLRDPAHSSSGPVHLRSGW